MNSPRIKHILALLGSLAAAVAPAWMDQQQTLVAKAAITIATALFLAVNPAKLKSYRAGILGGLAVSSVVLAGVVGHFGAGSIGLAVGGFVLALLAQLRVIFARDLAAPAESSEAVTKPILAGVPRDPEKGISDAVAFALMILAVLVLAAGIWAVIALGRPSDADAEDDTCPNNTFYVGWDAIGPDCRSVLDREVRVISAANVAAAMAKCERACAGK